MEKAAERASVCRAAPVPRRAIATVFGCDSTGDVEVTTSVVYRGKRDEHLWCSDVVVSLKPSPITLLRVSNCVLCHATDVEIRADELVSHFMMCISVAGSSSSHTWKQKYWEATQELFSVCKRAVLALFMLTSSSDAAAHPLRVKYSPRYFTPFYNHQAVETKSVYRAIKKVLTENPAFCHLGLDLLC